MSREYSARELPTPGDDTSATSLSHENREVLTILQEARDLSHGSEELLAKSRSLANPGLLSPEAANFLQPFASLLRGTALILGDAGPLARFVAEFGCGVWVSQPDRELAVLAEARCKGLDVKIGATLTPSAGTKFDVIIVIALRGGFDFQPLRDALHPQGVIIAAADNRLANGVAESVTRVSLENNLRAAGLNHFKFYLAFPSYKTARVAMSEEFPASFLAIEHIIEAHSFVAGENWWRDVLANGILKSMANSFVAVAGLSPFQSPLQDDVLQIYSTNRRKHFARVTTVQRSEQGPVFLRAPLFPSAKPPSGSDFVLRAYTEPYLAGQSYADLLGPIVRMESWTLDDLAKWAQPWIDLLRSNATEYEFRGYIGGFRRLWVLPGRYVDCIPSNIMLDASGKLSPFDFEYEAAVPVPVNFVVFRGLFYTLSNVTVRSGPSASTLIDIVTNVMELCGLQSTPAEIDSFIETEAAFQDAVVAAPQTSTIESMRARMLHLGIREGQKTYPAVTVELFWKSKNSQYSSKKSATALLVADQEQHLITFVIPAEKKIDTLRFDPSDQPGAFRIHAIHLYGGKGENLWTWSGDLHSLWVSQSDVNIDLDQPSASGMDTLMVSVSHDPHIELAIGPDLLTNLQSGGRMEVAMSWAESGAVPQPSLNLQEKERLTTELNQMIAENQRLLAVKQEVESLTNRIAELSSLTQTVQDVHEQVARLTADTQRAERAREAASLLNSELQEQLKTVNQELRSVSTDRDLVHRHIRQLQELQARVEHVEQLVAGIFQGRIWRTLTLLSSPLKMLRRKP